MLEFHEKRKLKRLLYSKAVLFVLLVTVLIFARGVWGIYQKERNAREKRAEAQSMLTELQKREASLEANIARLKTQKGVEEEIRSRFDVAKEGEHVLILVDAPQEKKTESPREPEGLWETIQS